MRFKNLVTVLLILCMAGLPALAKTDKASKKKSDKDKVFRKAPTLGVQGIEGREQVFEIDSLNNSIEDLQSLLDIEEDSEKPKTLERLAEIYWEKAEYYYSLAYGNKLFHRLALAQQKNDKKAVAKIRAQQQQLLQLRAYWQQQAVNIYKTIVIKYKNYSDLDTTLYYLGYTLVMMGRGDEAYPYFIQLVREFPQSKHIPEALLNLGEYFFNQGKMKDALELYTKVEDYKQSKAYAMAMYKKAWCYYNLGKEYYQQSLNQFLKVIRYAKAADIKKLPYKDRLVAEASRDLVMVYAQIGSPDQAQRLFKSIAPKKYVHMLLRLAKAYAEQGSYNKANRVYQILMAKKLAKEHPYLIIKYQLLIVKNSFNQPKKSVIIRETRRLLRAIKKFGPTAPKAFMERQMASVDELLRNMIQTYDKEVSVTKEKSTMAFLVELEGAYMQLFPKSAFRGAVAMRYANLLERIGKYEAAADWFYTAYKLNPKAKKAIDDLHDAVMDYLQVIDLKAKGEKPEETQDLAEKKIPQLQAKAIKAAQIYIKVSNNKSPDIEKIKYAAAKLLYDYNHFKEAIPLFEDIVQNNSGTKIAPVAAKLLLSSFHLTRDIDNLNRWANKIASNPKLMRGDVARIVTEIRNQAEYNKCFTFEKKKKYAKAGDCFMAYIRKFPDTKIKDRAMLNASGNYFRARMVLKALKTIAKLVNDMPDSKLAPMALYNLADFYRKIAIYSEAANKYEAFVTNYPKHKLAEKALRYAMVFWYGLGEYRKSIRDSRIYLRKFPKTDKAPRVFLQIGLTMEKQKNWRAAGRQFATYKRHYGMKAGIDSYLRCLKEIATCYRHMHNQARANRAYKAVVDAYNKLPDEQKKKVGIEGLDATAESLFMLGEMVLAQMRRVKLRMPQKILEKRIKKKLALLKKAIGMFADVEKFGRPNWTIAAHQRRGLGFKELATSIENAPVPRRLTADQKMYYRNFLQQKAVPIWEQAKREFMACVQTAKRLKWYNKYSEEAEKELRTLDPNFKSLPEFKAKAIYFHLNSARPAFIAPTVDSNPPSWTDDDLKTRLDKDLATNNPKAMVNMGLYMLGTGHPDKAKEYFQKAVAKASQCPNGKAALAFMDLLAGRMDAAQQAAQEVLTADPLNGLANDIMAQVDSQHGALAKAMVEARKALITNPEDMNAYLTLAAGYKRLKQLDVGILVCNSALNLEKTQPQMLNILGLIYLARNDVKTAVHNFEAAVRAKPDFVDALMNLGAATLAYKDFNTAIAQFEKVIQLQPDNAMALLSLGAAYRGANRPADAQKVYAKLVQAHPNNLDVHFNACVLYQESMAKYDKAARECKRFLDMAGPRHPMYKEVSQRYKGILDTIKVLKESNEAEQPKQQPRKGAPAVKKQGGKSSTKPSKASKSRTKTIKGKKKGAKNIKRAKKKMHKTKK